MPATLQEVAAAAHVSPATVSRVLNSRQDVAPETVRLVEEALQRLGYQRAATRRGRPVGGRSNSATPLEAIGATAIAFVVAVVQEEALHSTLTGQLVDGIEAVASQWNLHFHLARLPQARRLPACLDPVQVDGLIIRGALGGLSEPLPKIPTVWVFKLDHASIAGDLVQPDNEMIGEMAARYLLERNHRHLAVVTARPDHPEAQIRADRFMRNALAGGATVLAIEDRDMERAADQLLSQPHPVTGLFMPLGDRHLEALYRALQNRGIHCGGEGAEPQIISCNNDATHLRMLDPTLANIDIRAGEIGRVAAQTLLWRIQHPEEHRRCILIEPQLVAGVGQ